MTEVPVATALEPTADASEPATQILVPDNAEPEVNASVDSTNASELRDPISSTSIPSDEVQDISQNLPTSTPRIEKSHSADQPVHSIVQDPQMLPDSSQPVEGIPVELQSSSPLLDVLQGSVEEHTPETSIHVKDQSNQPATSLVECVFPTLGTPEPKEETTSAAALEDTLPAESPKQPQLAEDLDLSRDPNALTSTPSESQAATTPLLKKEPPPALSRKNSKKDRKGKNKCVFSSFST